jgi:hypothetical protein
MFVSKIATIFLGILEVVLGDVGETEVVRVATLTIREEV